MFTTHVQNFYSQYFSSQFMLTTLAHKICSQLFITFVHNFFTAFLTILVYSYYSNLLFITFDNSICFKLLLTPLVHNSCCKFCSQPLPQHVLTTLVHNFLFTTLGHKFFSQLMFTTNQTTLIHNFCS